MSRFQSLVFYRQPIPLSIAYYHYISFIGVNKVVRGARRLGGGPVLVRREKEAHRKNELCEVWSAGGERRWGLASRGGGR
jgi:hypothetical protein